METSHLTNSNYEIKHPHYEYHPGGAFKERPPGRGRPDLLPPRALLAISKRLEIGAQKYGDNNYCKYPLNWLLESALRHLLKYMAGMEDEDHLAAAATNLLFMLEIIESNKQKECKELKT